MPAPKERLGLIESFMSHSIGTLLSATILEAEPPTDAETPTPNSV